ncbi:MAG: uroporphyrinogen-III C-methyltransferase [Verrucomicrobia bacterium]|nr:uroporphyrinogen-III C-methyltransferase [Verrucomicrobiota bacterium]
MKKQSQSKNGICYLIGAGPGDPGLLTVRGAKLLHDAEIVIYDYLCNPILLQQAPATAEKIYVGKAAGKHTLSQEEINQLLVKSTQDGKLVVRLKGGDPFLFGRGGEEAEALEDAGLKFEIVPGITSAIGGLAYAGIPVTHRASNAMLTIFTGHEDPAKKESKLDYDALATTPGTKVMLMGMERLEKICEELLAAGMEKKTPVALVRWASTPRQETLTGTLVTIAKLAQEKNFKAPALAVFGEVVSLREKLNWFETKPLFRKRIAVTRTREKASELVKTLRDLGADAYELPTIRIKPVTEKKDREAFVEALAQAHHYDWIVFTSPNGVAHFFEAFYKLHRDARELGNAKIAAIGPGTAQKIEEYRFGVDLIPPQFVAESLLKEFKKLGVENLKILLPRASGSREMLAVELENFGAIVDDVPVYETVGVTDDVAGGWKRFAEEGADLVTFTSGSTAQHFKNYLEKNSVVLPLTTTLASIGPVTSSVMKELGMKIGLEAKQHDIPGLVAAIVDHLENSPQRSRKNFEDRR